jgi:DHA2 family multidrug resistance protein
MNPQRPNPAIIFVAVLASLLEIVDSSIVNVALPTMMGNLGATLEDISMVVTGYVIANAVVLPISAWLGERIGRRTYYLGCITAFTVTSVACGLAPNLTTLIIFRILQGLAGGALLPTSQTLIYEQFPKEKAGTAGAIFGMSVMIGPALGPVLGGYLTDQFGWRSIFNINMPLGIIALLVGMTCIYNPEYQMTGKPKGKLDFIGFSLLVLGIGCLQFVLERGEANDWFDSTSIVVNTIIAALALPSFVFWELRVASPIINVRLFKERVVSCGVTLMASLGFFLYSLVFLLPVFLSRAFSYDATDIGELFIPGSMLTAFMMPFIGKMLQSGRNPKILIAIGFISIEICLYMVTLCSPQSSKWQVLQLLFVRGFAMAFLFIPINSSILSQFKGQALGQVSGLMNLFRQLGGSIGIAMTATLLTKTSQQNFSDLASRITLLNPTTYQAYHQGVVGMTYKMRNSVGFATGMKASAQSIFYRIQAQAFMLSIGQLMWIVMIIFAFAFIPLYLIQFRTKSQEIVGGH